MSTIALWVECRKAEVTLLYAYIPQFQYPFHFYGIQAWPLADINVHSNTFLILLFSCHRQNHR